MTPSGAPDTGGGSTAAGAGLGLVPTGLLLLLGSALIALVALRRPARG